MLLENSRFFEHKTSGLKDTVDTVRKLTNSSSFSYCHLCHVWSLLDKGKTNVRPPHTRLAVKGDDDDVELRMMMIMMWMIMIMMWMMIVPGSRLNYDGPN